MTEPMTLEEFDRLKVQFGQDIDAWPDGTKEAAQAFLATPEGARLQAAEDHLAAMFDAARQTGEHQDDEANAFLERLLDIPGQHEQLASSPAPTKTGGLISLVREIREQFSPLALASQGAAFAAVLAVGVFIGLQTPEEDSMSLDLSSTLFASSTDIYLEE